MTDAPHHISSRVERLVHLPHGGRVVDQVRAAAPIVDMPKRNAPDAGCPGSRISLEIGAGTMAA
jgi:hypothetical protein